MAYRLKTVRYHNNDRKILLQNENGPCPLLAAANALLLRGAINLPSTCIRNGCASLDEVVNVLAVKAMNYQHTQTHEHAAESAEQYVHEVLDILPLLQYGMDVNPKFTQGPTGVEFTSQLTAFDLLNVKLVHGWLIDPESEELMRVVGPKTYNELVELVIHGSEAEAQLHTLQKQLAAMETFNDDEWVEIGVEVDMTTADDNIDTDREAKETTEPASAATPTVGTPTIGPTIVALPPPSGSLDLTGNPHSGPDLIDLSDLTPPPPPSVPDEVKETEQSANTTAAPDTIPPTKERQPSVDQPKSKTQEEEPSDPQQEPPQKLPKKEPQRATVGEQRTRIRESMEDLSHKATMGNAINNFLNSTGHQLTQHGLSVLYEHLTENELVVFFRNNHFSTLTKHEGVIYLLVTDDGYANVSNVVWEKLDVIDGDTEYVDAAFSKPAPQKELSAAAQGTGSSLDPEQLLAQRGQAEADYQLALQLSKGGDTAGTDIPSRSSGNGNMDEHEGKLMAAATEASLKEYNGIPSSTPPLTQAQESEAGGSSATTAEKPPLQSHYHNDPAVSQEDADRMFAMQLQAALQESDTQVARQMQRTEWAANNNPTRNPNNTRPQEAGVGAKNANCVIS